MRFVIISLVLLWMSPSALACSCVIENEWTSAKQEYEAADVIFKGYLIGQQLMPLESCTTYSVPKGEFSPIGQFKVVKAEKGTFDEAVIVAKLGGVFSVQFDGNCEFFTMGNSCQHDFYRGHYGTEKQPRWFAMTLHNGELWANSNNCSGFAENAERIVARYSKRDKK